MPLARPEHQILGRAIGLMMDLTRPAQEIAFAKYRSSVREARKRVELLTESMRAQLEDWRMRPAVVILPRQSACFANCREVDHGGNVEQPSRLWSRHG